jgi:Tol biopolymer transport system component
MNETRELLERTGDAFELPDRAFERLLRRRERRERNRRISAWATAAAIGIAAAVFAVRSLPTGSDRTATTPSVTPTPPAVPQLDLTSGRHAFVELDDGEATKIPREIDGGFFYPVSPDGARVVFNPCCAPGDRAYVANLDGTGMRQLSSDDLDAVGVRWSPDGRSVVYQGLDYRRGWIGDLYVTDVATGAQTQVTHLEQFRTGWWFLSPSFSADGSQILFHLPRGPDAVRWDLWSVPVAGGEPTLVRRNAGFGAYSPDGRSLLYLSPIEGFSGVSLWVLDVDGGEPRELADGPALTWPRWSPDGTKISYGKDDAVFVVDLISGESRRVARGSQAEWFDDDTLILSLP